MQKRHPPSFFLTTNTGEFHSDSHSSSIPCFIPYSTCLLIIFSWSGDILLLGVYIGFVSGSFNLHAFHLSHGVHPQSKVTPFSQITAVVSMASCEAPCIIPMRVSLWLGLYSSPNT